MSIAAVREDDRMPTTKSLAAGQAVQLAAICALMRTLPDETATECLHAFRDHLRSLLNAVGDIDEASDQAMLAQLALIEKALQRG